MISNGVSFSLVAGACCAVYFSNGLSNRKSVTVNINSTGAIPLRYNNWYLMTYALTGGSNQEIYNTYPNTNTVLLIHTGSEYHLQMPLKYGDYSD